MLTWESKLCPLVIVDCHECRQPTAAEVLRAVATARGWVVQQALPDEARAGRLVLKDFCSGRLLHAHSPPGAPRSAPAGGEPVMPCPTQLPALALLVLCLVCRCKPLYWVGTFTAHAAVTVCSQVARQDKETAQGSRC